VVQPVQVLHTRQHLVQGPALTVLQVHGCHCC
jgi:hypothetical protein